jgi:eukaryotic-like serine/threonine-protein kinase
MPHEKPDIQAIFNEAAARDSDEDRRRFVDEACGNDPEARARIEVLLRAHSEAGNFFGGKAPPSATLDMPRAAEPPGTQIGPYKLREQIGEGGFGVVYVAEQEKPVARKVALKIIKPGMDTRDVIARFEAERQALALMDHPNIAKVLDAGTTGGNPKSGAISSKSEIRNPKEIRSKKSEAQKLAVDSDLDIRNSDLELPSDFGFRNSDFRAAGRPYFVMELVRGVPITEFCDERKLNTRERLALFIDVCRAVQHAHQKGIIHRDIKPSNVMVTLRDDKPIPKVIDFGVSKALSSKLTEKTIYTAYGQMIGTPLYMSPEQAQLNEIDVDTRSDVYSLGVLLYELLTGTTPFDKETLQKSGFDEMRRIIREVDPPRPSARISTLRAEMLSTVSDKRKIDPRKLGASLRGELDWIVMKALEKDRNRRYETASALAADVERYLADEPVQARPASVWYRFRKFARRNRGGLCFAGLVLFFIALLGGGAGWALRDRAAREKEFADEREAQHTAVEREFNLAFKDAERWQAQARWPEALSAAKRAEGLLAGGRSDELRERVREVRKGLDMVQRLEETSLIYSEIKQDEFDYGGADRAYANAFAEFGIDFARLLPSEAAARIRARPGIAVALLAALDEWEFIRQSRVFQNQKRRSTVNIPLAEVIQTADLDPWRRHVREAVKRQDAKALAALAASPTIMDQPPTSLRLLGQALGEHVSKAAEIALLRQAQRKHRGDFWINEYLAGALMEAKPPRVDEAVSFYRAALAVRPRNAATLNNLGNALRRRRMLVDAVACFLKATELAPKFVLAHYNLGNARMSQGKLDEAIVCFRRAIEISPRGSRYHTHLGIAFSRQRKWNQAIACMHKAIECQPDNVVAHSNLALNLVRQGKPVEAENWARKALALKRKFADAHNVLGMALHDQKKLDAAIASYRKAIELNPKFADAYSNLGNALQDQRKFQEAIASYHKAIAIDRGHLGAHFCLGNAFYRQNKFDDAIVWYRKALKIDPKYANAHSGLGIAFKAQGKFAEAVTSLRKAIELDPNHFNAHNNWASQAGALLGQWKVNRSVKLLKQAVEAGNKAVELAPTSTWAWQCLGSIHYQAGNWKASIVALERSCKLQPGGTGDSGQWIVLALAHARLAAETGRLPKQREYHTAQARRWYEAADKQIDTWWRDRPGHATGQDIWDFRTEAAALLGLPDPGRASALFEQARSLHGQKKFAEAETALREVVRLKPAHLQAHVLLGWTLQSRRKFPEAEAAFRGVIRLKFDHAEAHAGLGRVLLAQKKSRDALVPLRKAILLGAKNPWVYSALGWALLQENQPSEAEAAFRGLARLTPDRANGYAGLGRALVAQKKFAEAETALRAALRLEPAHRWVPDVLRQALVGQGKHAEARELMRRRQRRAAVRAIKPARRRPVVAPRPKRN